MRLRNESLKTGKALAWMDSEGRGKRSRALLFLIEGAADIEPISQIEKVCRSLIEKKRYPGFTWHAVADPGQISLVDSRLYSAEIFRFEACEFRDLEETKLRPLLRPVLDLVVAGSAELLPRAGGAVGGPAEGVQFLNRVTELEELATAIRDGKSLFLQAPRRMGKTSLMRRLQARLANDREPVALNLERDTTPAELAARLKSLETGGTFRSAQRAAQADPNQVLEASTEAICKRSTKPLVLFLDELAVVLRSMESLGDEASRRNAVLSFLSALGGPLERNAACVVVAGSVDWLDYLRTEYTMDEDELPGVFSRIERVPLKPLDFPHPDCELRRVLLGSGMVPDSGDIDWFQTHLDLTVPYPALKFLDRLLEQTQVRSRLTAADMDQLLTDFLGSTDCFSDFEEHLHRKRPDLPGSEDAASEALDAIAREPFESGADREQVNVALCRAGSENAALLSSWLRNTFPVTIDGRVRFTSRLFRLWWRSQMQGVALDDE